MAAEFEIICHEDRVPPLREISCELEGHRVAVAYAVTPIVARHIPEADAGLVEAIRHCRMVVRNRAFLPLAYERLIRRGWIKRPDVAAPRAESAA